MLKYMSKMKLPGFGPPWRYIHGGLVPLRSPLMQFYTGFQFCDTVGETS